MASKWHGQVCPVCGVGHLFDGVKSVEQAYKGNVFHSEARGAFCNHCADGVVATDTEEEAAWLAFRDQVDAAEGAELARIRKKLRLSQAQAARLTGGGKNAFSRYERGQSKPMAAVINLFRLLDGHPEFIKDLHS